MFFNILIVSELINALLVVGLPIHQTENQKENQANEMDWLSCNNNKEIEAIKNSSVKSNELILNVLKEIKDPIRMIEDKLTKYETSANQHTIDKFFHDDDKWLPSSEKRNSTRRGRLRLLGKLYNRSRKFWIAFYYIGKKEVDKDKKQFFNSIIEELKRVVCTLHTDLLLIKSKIPEKVKKVPKYVLNAGGDETYRQIHIYIVITKFKEFIKHSLNQVEELRKSTEEKLLRKSQKQK